MAYSKSDIYSKLINTTATIKISVSKLNLTTRSIEKQLANLKKENRLQRVGNAKKEGLNA